MPQNVEPSMNATSGGIVNDWMTDAASAHFSILVRGEPTSNAIAESVLQ
jgi:hypothetical protein